MSELSKIIQKNAGTYGADLVYMLTCIVDSVDEGGRLCMVIPINNNIASFPAHLMAEIDDGILRIPSKGSTVKIIFSSLNAPTVVQFSELDKIFYVAGGSTFLIDKSGIQLEGTKYGGIPEVGPTSDKIIALENKLNDLLVKWNAFCAAYVPGSPTVSGLPLTLTTSDLPVISPITQRSDLENAKVLHGDGS